jgi:hypothetical protein
VVHYGDPGKTGADEIYMGYTTGTEWTLAANDVPAHIAGDKIMFNVMAYPVEGTGDTDIAKAAYLNTATVTGSDWSRGSSVTFA